ncbi:MAG: 3-isopropylmalate dehydratase [Candidatus Lokiarchaeota archaeon]|nr:3-isopropylmalate dehydratase [Candidatus Lokiarchaeota archaeon]
MDLIKGYAYILGDDISTDDIVPSHTLTMRDSDDMVKHTLEFIDPYFSKNVDKGNIIIAGENFGTGSSREEAVHVFKFLGIKAVVARSFARIYFRNLMNNGIPAISLKWDLNQFAKEDVIKISLLKGIIINKSKNITLNFEKIPDFLMDILENDGVINQLKKKL